MNTASTDSASHPALGASVTWSERNSVQFLATARHTIRATTAATAIWALHHNALRTFAFRLERLAIQRLEPLRHRGGIEAAPQLHARLGGEAAGGRIAGELVDRVRQLARVSGGDAPARPRLRDDVRHAAAVRGRHDRHSQHQAFRRREPEPFPGGGTREYVRVPDRLRDAVRWHLTEEPRLAGDAQLGGARSPSRSWGGARARAASAGRRPRPPDRRASASRGAPR